MTPSEIEPATFQLKKIQNLSPNNPATHPTRHESSCTVITSWKFQKVLLEKYMASNRHNTKKIEALQYGYILPRPWSYGHP